MLVLRLLSARRLFTVVFISPVSDVAWDVLHGSDVDELALLPVPLLVVVDEGVQLAVDVQDGNGLVQFTATLL